MVDFSNLLHLPLHPDLAALEHLVFRWMARPAPRTEARCPYRVPRAHPIQGAVSWILFPRELFHP